MPTEMPQSRSENAEVKIDRRLKLKVAILLEKEPIEDRLRNAQRRLELAKKLEKSDKSKELIREIESEIAKDNAALQEFLPESFGNKKLSPAEQLHRNMLEGRGFVSPKEVLDAYAQEVRDVTKALNAEQDEGKKTILRDRFAYLRKRERNVERIWNTYDNLNEDDK